MGCFEDMGNAERAKKPSGEAEGEQKSQPTGLTERMADALESRMDSFREWLGKRYESKFIEIEKESKARMAANELALFAHPLIRLGVFIGALVVFLSILQLTAPPRGVVKALEGKNVVYVKDAELCFGQGCLNNPAKIHRVTLPFFDNQSFRDYKDHDLYYRLRPGMSLHQIEGELDSLVVPIPWGNAEVYRSGALVATGPNFWPIIPLENGADEIVIRVLNPSGQKFGIRGIVAPFVVNRNLARTIESEMVGEPYRWRYAFVAQLSGMGLLLIMFFTFPYRPELFAFLVLFGIETLRARILTFSYYEGLIFLSPIVDNVLENFLRFAGAATVVYFVGLFLRRSFYELTKQLMSWSGYLPVLLIALYLIQTTKFPSLNTKNAFYISCWVTALVASLAVSKDSVLYLFQRKMGTRLILSCFALGAVCYWAMMNIWDRFIVDTAITSEDQNHFHFFFVMATILAIEIGRTEIKIKEAFSLLSKEVVRLIHDERKDWREGFVVLVDVVGWTAKLKQLDSSEMPEFERAINAHLLSVFEDEPNVSVISGTGDGYYFTFEEGPTEACFLRLVDACRRLAIERPKFGDIGMNFDRIREDRLIVRSAIAYCRYYTGIARSRKLKLRRDHCTCIELPLLQRVMGDDNDPIGPRILADSKLDNQRKDSPLLSQKTKGDIVKFWIPN